MHLCGACMVAIISLLVGCTTDPDKTHADNAASLSFAANPPSTTPGGSVVLSWSASNVDTCTASGDWSGAKALGGSESSSPLTDDSTFTLDCAGSNGGVSKTVGVPVNPALPIINGFSAMPSAIAAAESAILTWTTTNADSVSINGGASQPADGSLSVSPTTTTTYTLAAMGPGGTSTATVSVSVAGPAAMVPFTRLTVAEGQAPWGKYLADVNGDGLLDVVVGGGYVLNDNVYWYRSPDFTRFQIGSVGGDDDLQVADINGDGALDVVVNGGIYWYENPRGTGGNATASWTRHNVDPSNNVHDLVVGDVNDDGAPDILARGEFGPTTLYIQNGPDDWTKVHLANAPDGEGSAIGDLDRDGRVDIVGNGYWLKQPDDPVTKEWVKFNIGAWPEGSAVFVADINKDGRLDVFLSASEVGVGSLSWFEAPADPLVDSWTRHDIDSVEDVHRFHLVDLNKDGHLDVVFAEMHQSDDRRIGVYYNTGLGNSWLYDELANTGGHNIAIGDIENDGDIDLLVSNWQARSPDGGRISIWRNDGNAAISMSDWAFLQVDGSKPDRAFGLTFADMNGDNRRDIISGRNWYANPGGDMSGSWTHVDLGFDVDAMLVLDVDGDGQMDLIAQSDPGNGDVPVYWLQPNNAAATSFSRTEIGTLPPDPADGTSQGYAKAQIVRGGKPELVFSSDGIFYFEIPSDPSTEDWPRTQVTSEAREEGIAAADIDLDGDIDIVGIVAPSGTTMAWWENPGNGSGSWTRHDLGSTSGAVADRIAIADINHDTLPDVIVTETNLSASGNAVYWYERPANPGNNNWTRRTIASNKGSLNSMSVTDFNGDGLPDVITGEHRGSLRVVVWENVNNGASWVAHAVDAGKESHLGTQLDDLDNDGDTDVISIGFDSEHLVSLWRNDGI